MTGASAVAGPGLPGLPCLDEIVLDWVDGPGFDRLLVSTVRSVYPAAGHGRLISHLLGLVRLWVADESGGRHGT